ncbi:MAG TPA: TIM barrel protein [Bryobacteraceae bacterium]|nr:TIM barrel protein [Bryobacteraceae bacterium]
MLRRTLLQLPAAAALAQRKAAGFKLSVRVEPIFPGLRLAEQLQRVAEAGYQGFEFGDWRAADAAEITRLKNRLGLECVCLVGNRSVNPKGMGLCDPAERGGFLQEIAASIEAAKRFESARLVVLTGNRAPHLSREAQRASIVEGLKRAAAMAAPAGIQLIVEVLNTRAKVEPLNPRENHANYYLNSTREAFQLLRAADSPNVKVLFDIYHVQIMEGNLIDTIRTNISSIGHFHVGDVPGRHEPGTGEINYRNVFRAIRDAGFRDFVAMEYVPLKDAMTTLRETKAIAEAQDAGG